MSRVVVPWKPLAANAATAAVRGAGPGVRLGARCRPCPPAPLLLTPLRRRDHSKQALSRRQRRGPSRRSDHVQRTRRQDGASSPAPAGASGWASPSGWSTRAPGSASPPASPRRWTRRWPRSAGRTHAIGGRRARPTTPTTARRRSTPDDRDVRQPRPAGQQHRHQPGRTGRWSSSTSTPPARSSRSTCSRALAWVQEAHRAWMGEHGGAVVNVSSVAGRAGRRRASRCTAPARRC